MGHVVDIQETGVKKTEREPFIMPKKLLLCCVGIFVCYFYYGILQEKM